MKITIDVDTWGEAHHIACALADLAWDFRTSAATEPTFGLTEALNRYADFFGGTARAITKQAAPLNEAAWLERKKNLDDGLRHAGPVPAEQKPDAASTLPREPIKNSSPT